MSSYNRAIGGLSVRVPYHSFGRGHGPRSGNDRGRLRSFGGERGNQKYGVGHGEHGIGRKSRSERPDGPREVRKPERVDRPQSVERTRSKSVSESSSLSLTVTTAEGDTVELSIEAQSLRQSEKTYTRDENGVTRSRSKSKEENVSASISVEGDLNEEELADIQELLDSIGSGGGHDLDETDSLNSYDYTLTKSREVSVSTVAIYA